MVAVAVVKYVKGDLFTQIREPSYHYIIPHIVNDIGAWGSGFVVPLGNYYPEVKERYLSDYELGWIKLGKTDFIYVPKGQITVANMCAQTGIGKTKKPIRYEALVSCMRTVVSHIKMDDRLNEQMNCPTLPTKIIAPKFGSDRAGGNWDFIEELINEIWADFDTTIYYLND